MRWFSPLILEWYGTEGNRRLTRGEETIEVLELMHCCFLPLVNMCLVEVYTAEGRATRVKENEGLFASASA